MCTSARTSAAAAALLASAALGGCALGPDFQRPAPPRIAGYGDVAGAPTPVGRPVPAAWWRGFGSARLDALMDEALAASPTQASAKAALAAAQAQVRAGAGVFWPQADGALDATRQQTTPALQGLPGRGATFSLVTLAGAITYPLDLFGGERRGVEALRAQADAASAGAGAAQLLLTGALSQAAVARAAYAEQEAVLARIVGLDQAQQQAFAAQAAAGQGEASAVLAADQQAQADTQALALAAQRRAAAETLLHTLLGREAGDAAPPWPQLADFRLPAEVPMSLPSDLVRERPDILQAEAELHQATAAVGVATAALFPSVTLTGEAGSAARALNGLSGAAGRFWSGGADLAAPIFEGGALWSGRRAAQAQMRRAAADYRQTVLVALEQVADGLHATRTDQTVEAAARRVAEAAGLDARLAKANRQAGVIAGLDEMSRRLVAERARLAEVSAIAQSLEDRAALYVACGGGWTSASPLSQGAAR